MKRILLTASLIVSVSAKAMAPIFSCSDGVANFISYAPLEIIRAKSNHLRGAIDVSARTFLFAIRVNTFQGFNSGLQQEHFNENYMEAEKFPEATFRGKFIEEVDLTKDGTYDVRAKGMLGLHGVLQERIINGTIEVKNGAMHIHSQFSILLEDHNITVPRVVYQKISPEMEVTIDATLKATK
ncbi:MAG TPA: YceI family protein [Chitinophagales bacterium]|nr:YceI family protein [Chitinophagales bacterium]